MSGDRSKIVERIRKLLALADDKGATEAEAVAAVMMAQRLMAENDVADWELHSMDEQPIATRRKRACAQAVALDACRCNIFELPLPILPE